MDQSLDILMTASDVMASLEVIGVQVVLRDGKPVFTGDVDELTPWIKNQCKRLRGDIIEMLSYPGWDRGEALAQIRKAITVWDSLGYSEDADIRKMQCDVADEIDAEYEAKCLDGVKARVGIFMDLFPEPEL